MQSNKATFRWPNRINFTTFSSYKALINADLAKVVHDAFAASANAMGQMWIPVKCVAKLSRQNTEPAAFMARGDPFAIAGIPIVTERTRTAEW